MNNVNKQLMKLIFVIKILEVFLKPRKSEISDRKSEIIDNNYCTAKLEMVLCKDLNINNISIGPASYTTCRTKECHKDMIERVSLDSR